MNTIDDSISYAKDRYHEEQARLFHVEEKCYRMITLLTLSIAAFGGAFSLKSDVLLNPKSPLEWITLSIASICFITLACSWGHALRALKIGDWPIAPKSKENCDYILNSTKEESQQHIYDCYVDTTQIIDQSIKEKIESLEHSYNEMALSAFLIASFFVSIAIMELIA